MIVFVATREHVYTHRAVQMALGTDRIGLVRWDDVLRSRKLPAATYVFTDLDRLSAVDLHRAAVLYRRLNETSGFRALNDPGRLRLRYSLLRALHAAGLNDFTAWRLDGEEDLEQFRYPVFLRLGTEHKPPLTDLLPDPDALLEALARAIDDGYPRCNLLAVEFCGEPVAGNLYRRIGAYRIGEKVVPDVHVHQDHWCVKYGKKGCATDVLYREEYDTVSTNPYAERLEPFFRAGEIEYGRADFSLVNGRIQVYEVNTNPNISAPGDHPVPLRVRSTEVVWNGYLAAIEALEASGD